MPASLEVEVFGKYELLRSLGRGGMAEIFLARERGRGELLVLKRVLPHLAGAHFGTMLLSEAKVASLLSHPGIVRILELGREEEQVYLAMEYVPGWNLHQLTRAAGGPIPALVGARIAASVAEALAHAHQTRDLEGRPLRMVHRDVTPGNVMVTPAGEVKLIDFGVAKALTQLSLTSPGILKGKARFMSPEQVRQQPLDGRSDLFSLGVTLYEITTGHQAFGRPSSVETLEAVVGGVPRAPHELVPDFPEALEAVVLRALAKDPDARYPDGEAMAAALLEVLRRPAGRIVDVALYVRELALNFPQILPPPEELTRLTQRDAATEVMTGDELRRWVMEPTGAGVGPPAEARAVTETAELGRGVTDRILATRLDAEPMNVVTVKVPHETSDASAATDLSSKEKETARLRPAHRPGPSPGTLPFGDSSDQKPTDPARPMERKLPLLHRAPAAEKPFPRWALLVALLLLTASVAALTLALLKTLAHPAP